MCLCTYLCVLLSASPPTPPSNAHTVLLNTFSHTHTHVLYACVWWVRSSLVTLCHCRLNEANKKLLESEDVDNAIQGPLMCVSVCMCASLPPATNMAVCFCLAALELIRRGRLGPPCCCFPPVPAAVR